MAWLRLLYGSRTFLAAPGLARLASPRPRSQPPADDDLIHNLERRSAWDRLYSEGRAHPFRHFDWFLGYTSICGFLQSLLEDTGGEGPRRVLDIGCGTSDLGPRLYTDSSFPIHVSCLDFSPVAIALMREKFSSPPPPRNPASQLHFLEADATDLSTFEQGTFDLILDKGTLDALLRAKDGGRTARTMLSESLRVLCDGGSFLQITDEDPDARIPWLERFGAVSVSMHQLDSIRGLSYFAYIIKPTDRASRGLLTLSGRQEV